MPAPFIFISYRKDDSLSQARGLYQSLVLEFGRESVFYDNSSLQPGVSWPMKLEEKVKQANVVLVLIMNRTKWLGVDEDGIRRIDDEEDWVRKEVEMALSDPGKLVVPVLINEATLPSPNALPSRLRPLLGRQCKHIREKSWDDDLTILAIAIRNHFAPQKSLTHYVYTCDRDEQYTQYEQLESAFKPGSMHFFYIYGDEQQAHKSFFRRIVCDLEGKYQEELGSIRRNPVVKRIELSVESGGCSKPERLRERFIRQLFFAFGLNPANYSPLVHQNMTNLLSESEKTCALRAGSFVCIFAHISHWHWDPVLTPDATRWFIEEFCSRQLPPDSPAVLFFFALDFDDEDRPWVRKEVLETVKHEAKYVVSLPELEMVKKDPHIHQWLMKYVHPTHKRKEIAKVKFPKDQYFMEHVELVLKELIDDHLNNLQYEL